MSGRATHGSLHEALDGVALIVPDVGEVLAHLQGDKPQVEADGHGHDGIDDDQVAGGLQPGTAAGGKARERDYEGDEGEDGVGDTGYTRRGRSQNVSTALAHIHSTTCNSRGDLRSSPHKSPAVMFAILPLKGNDRYKRSRAASRPSVGSSKQVWRTMTQKPNMMAPMETNRPSATMKDASTLFTILSENYSRLYRLFISSVFVVVVVFVVRGDLRTQKPHTSYRTLSLSLIHRIFLDFFS